MKLDIHVLAWDRQHNVPGLNRVMRFQASSLNNWISTGNTIFDTEDGQYY